MIAGLAKKAVFKVIQGTPGLRTIPYYQFWVRSYIRHNQRVQEHLATLGLPIAGRTVFETGAGVGDHTTFFIDRGCRVTTSDGRPQNLRALKRRHPQLDVRLLDLEGTELQVPIVSEIVYCYGTLYHLGRPSEALEFLARCCTDLLLLETCVSYGNGRDPHFVAENAARPSQSLSGRGCRPTRPWVYAELKRHFPYVYLPRTQPYDPEFPLDWTIAPADGRLTRAIFIASRSQLDNDLLTEELPAYQVRG